MWGCLVPGATAQAAEQNLRALPISYASSLCILETSLLYSGRGIAPQTPKLQSMRRQPNGMPRMGPAMRARGMTPPHAIRPNVMTHLLRTGIEVGSDKCHRNHQMGEREPVPTVGKKGVAGVRRSDAFVDTFDPRMEDAWNHQPNRFVFGSSWRG
jgi:hypothetical protein